MDQSKIIPNPQPKPSKWRYLFIVLAVLQVAGIAGFFSILQTASETAQSGASGSEFIALFAFALVPFLGLLALINLIGLITYVIKRKPRRVVGWIFTALSFLLSGVLFAYGAYATYQMRVAIPNQENQAAQQRKEEFKKDAEQFAKDNAKPEITKEQAIELLQTCQLSGFYYTNQNDRDSGNWGELSSTGVVLTKINGKPFRISISDKLVPELVPVAREAQKKCGSPELWHDGSYEREN
jgi:hypothetical protein